jgi:hypothetical protein
MDQGWAVGIGGGALAVAVAGLELGRMALKRRRNSPTPHHNGQGEWRGKMETLLEQQLECMKDLRDATTEQTRVSGLLLQQTEQHEIREREAWRDLFRIMRPRNGR